MVFGINIRKTPLNEFSNESIIKKLKVKKPDGTIVELSFEDYRKFLADEVEKKGGIITREVFDELVKKHGIRDRDDLLKLRKHWDDLYYPEKGSETN